MLLVLSSNMGVARPIDIDKLIYIAPINSKQSLSASCCVRSVRNECIHSSAVFVRPNATSYVTSYK